MPANPQMVTWIIHAAFMMAVPIYALVGYTMLMPETPATTLTPIPLALLALSLVNVGAGLFIPRFIKSPPRLVPPGGSMKDAVVRQHVIVSDACFESIAIYGMIGFILDMPLWTINLLIGLSFIMLTLQVFRIQAWLGR